MVENPVHGYRFLLTHGRRRPLVAERERAARHRDPRRRGLQARRRARRPPDWAASSVIYQVFPDRFARSAAADERQAAGLGDPRGVGRRRRPAPAGPRRTSSTAATSTASPSTSTTSSALGVNLLYLTPGLPRPLQPPLRRAELRRGRPAARRRRGARPAGRGRARPRHPGDRRPHDQPLRRRATSGSWPRTSTRMPRRATSTTGATPSNDGYDVVARRARACPSSTGRLDGAAPPLHRRPGLGRRPAGCSRRSTSTAGASTWRT